MRGELNILATSEGGRNVSPDGSTFYIDFGQQGLKIPSTARNVSLTAEAATIWFVTPNIITDENDLLFITGPGSNDVLTSYIIEIPQGLYDLNGLENAIQRELANQGAKTSPDALISLLPDDATQRVQLNLNYLTVSVDFSQGQTPRTILGFDNIVLTSPPISWVANDIARFNQVNYFLIHSDLVPEGVRINGSFEQTIMQVLITISHGYLIMQSQHRTIHHGSVAQILRGAL